MRPKSVWAVTIIGIGLMGLLLSGSNQSLLGQYHDTGISTAGYPSLYTFDLDLGRSFGVTSFDECHGLGSSTDVLENTHDDLGVVQTTPGALRWHAIELSRTAPRSDSIWGWRQAMEKGDFDRAIREGTITMFPVNASEPIARWRFQSGWPSSLVLDGSVVRLTIVHDGLERIPTGDEPTGGR
jgi:hypothetical protein